MKAVPEKAATYIFLWKPNQGGRFQCTGRSETRRYGSGNLDARIASPVTQNIRHIIKEGILSNTKCLTRRIGSTTYKIKVHFSETGRETMEEKILRLVREESLDNRTKCGIMTMPQMDRQPEGSLQ